MDAGSLILSSLQSVTKSRSNVIKFGRSHICTHLSLVGSPPSISDKDLTAGEEEVLCWQWENQRFISFKYGQQKIEVMDLSFTYHVFVLHILTSPEIIQVWVEDERRKFYLGGRSIYNPRVSCQRRDEKRHTRVRGTTTMSSGKRPSCSEKLQVFFHESVGVQLGEIGKGRKKNRTEEGGK